MSPKKPSAGSGKKTARKGVSRKSVPEVDSPMRKIEHSVGPNVGGLDHAAVEAHKVPESAVPPRARSHAAPNTPAPPDVSTAGKPPAETTTGPDEGTER